MTEKTTKKSIPDKKTAEEDVIFVGQKPPMSYVLAVVTQFNGNGSHDVVLKARGRAISTAVDAAEIVRNKFVKNVQIKNINIGTESVTNEEGRTSNVSSIEIYLTTGMKSR
jgi:DNA-binding protein